MNPSLNNLIVNHIASCWKFNPNVDLDSKAKFMFGESQQKVRFSNTKVTNQYNLKQVIIIIIHHQLDMLEIKKDCYTPLFYTYTLFLYRERINQGWKKRFWWARYVCNSKGLMWFESIYNHRVVIVFYGRRDWLRCVEKMVCVRGRINLMML